MATTSGIYNTLTVTRTAIITQAMKIIRYLPSGGTPSADDLSTCSTSLNMIIKMMETKGLLLWLYDIVSVPLVQNQYIYSIGPGGDVDPGYRPLRVMEGSTITDTCAANPAAVSLIVWSRNEYLLTSNKQALGVPNSVYYDLQMQGKAFNPVSYDPGVGKGVVYFYPAPSDSSHTAALNVQRPIQDWTSATETVDMPLEWYHALTKYLAAEIADIYEVPEQRIARLKQEAAGSLEYIADWGAQEWASISFQPDMRMGQQR